MKTDSEVLTYLKIYVALLILTLVTVGAAYLDLGVLGLPVALAIAIGKALLVVLFFMHVLHSMPLIRLFVVAGLLWLLLLIGGSLADFLQRDELFPETRPAKTWVTKSATHYHPDFKPGG